MGIDDGIAVTPTLVIPSSELSWKFGPSGGPGGQHANTANTRAELVFEITESPTLSSYQRAKLEETFGPRVRIVVDETRSQLRNRDIALDRLGERLRVALQPKRARRPTKPGKGAKERRLREKREGSERKARRRSGWDD